MRTWELRSRTAPRTTQAETGRLRARRFGETRRAFAGTTKIDRKAFGLTWSKAVEAGPVVGDEVTITLELEVTKAAPQTASR